MTEENLPELLVMRRQEILRTIRTETEDEIAGRILALEQQLQQAEKISITDSLTELLNRSGLDQGWRRILDHLKRHPNEDPGVMVLLDLNDFKKANDSYGHAAGDAVLVEFATVIRELTRQEDTKGRRGGDEFEIHLDGASIGQAELILERINLELIERTKHLFNGTPVVSVSRGIIRIDLSKSVEELREMADVEMYKDKTARKMNKIDDCEDEIANNLGLRS